jgi:hypothetical protein
MTMTDTIKAGLIIGAAILLATVLWIYFSPYQSCVRAFTENAGDRNLAERHCATMGK